MAFPTEMLNQNEEILLDLRPHWWYIAPAAAGLAAALLLGIVSLAAGWPDAVRVVAGILVLVALGAFVVRYIRWVSLNFVVTSARVISRSGVIAKQGIEIPLERINTVFFNQTLFERVLGAGDLGIESAGEQGRQTFTDVRKPRMVHQEIYRARAEAEDQRMQEMGRAAAAGVNSLAGSGGDGLSIPEQIEKLDELRARGVITETEFREKKRHLLDRM